MRTYGKARKCDCHYNVCQSNPATKWWGTKRYRTRKDWRLRCWPSGENNQWFKKAARRLLRRTPGIWNGNTGRLVSSGYRYSINDFK